MYIQQVGILTTFNSKTQTADTKKLLGHKNSTLKICKVCSYHQQIIMFPENLTTSPFISLADPSASQHYHRDKKGVNDCQKTLNNDDQNVHQIGDKKCILLKRGCVCASFVRVSNIFQQLFIYFLNIKKDLYTLVKKILIFVSAMGHMYHHIIRPAIFY